MAIETWLEEFLYRGRPPSGPGSEEPPTFHVVLGQQAPNSFDPDAPPQRRTIGPMTPEQATAAGYGIEAVLESINTASLNELTTLRARVADLEAQLEAAQNSALKEPPPPPEE